MSITLVHDFHTETSAVQNVCPGVQDTTLRILDDWLKLNPLRLNAMVETPRAVNQIPITGHAARKKCRERELLKDAYWKIRRPK